MTLLALAVAAVATLSPSDGAQVPTQRDGQRSYLAADRAARFRQLDDPAARVRLAAVGCAQPPLELAWSTPDASEVRLEIGLADGDARQTFVLTNRTSVHVSNLEIGRRYVWKVTDAAGATAAASFVTAVDAPRFLRASGVGNFRDLGGWRTGDGRRVRQNMILRSAGLRFSSKSVGGLFNPRVELGPRRVTDQGLQTLRDEFHIRTDLELRTPQETAGLDASLIPGAAWVNVSYPAYGFINSEVRGREPFRRIFAVLTKRENYPVLMHCSGGRDRTGTLAFLLNGLLGVGEDDLCRDWEATAFYDSGAKFTSGLIRGLIDYLNTLPGATLQAKIEVYVRSCGISDADIAAFREIMLENDGGKR